MTLSAIWLAPLWRERTGAIQAAAGVLGGLLIGLRALGRPGGFEALGLRAGNVVPATFAFGLVTFMLCAPVVVVRNGEWEAPFPVSDLPSYFLWALFQQLVAVGGFWLPFRRTWGLPPVAMGTASREVLAAGAAALVFGLVHAPNVGLMALVGVAEWLWLCLFARWRNLASLSLAHASAALVVANHLVPSEWLPSMRVGLDYLGS